MRFYTTDQLGPNRLLTPEGFLLCKDVAIGRTGEQLYAAGEVPIRAGSDGIIHVSRDADSVFHDDTIASFQGKPITFDHPERDVTPRNWCSLAKGVVQNPRRGVGTSDSLLLADLLITDHATIEAVKSNSIRQVSCGYDAEYEQVSPGYGRQRNIIGNHVALVERGRCGERCAIGDKAMSTQPTTWKDRVRNTLSANDSTGLEAVLKDLPDKLPTTATTDGDFEGLFKKFADKIDARFNDIEKKLSTHDGDDDDDDDEEKKKKKKKEDDESDDKKDDDDKDDDEEDDDDKKKKKSEDSAHRVRDAAPITPFEIQEVVSRAEILAPGLRLPTFDSASEPSKVRDSLCGLRRQALTRYADTSRGRAVVLPFTSDGKVPDFGSMTCDSVSAIFIGASEVAKRDNNFDAMVTADASRKAGDVSKVLVSINETNSKFWSRA